MFILFDCLIYFGLAIIEALLGIDSEGRGGVVTIIYQLAISIPSLSIAVRRMHDVSKSGWYILIPIYNFILLIRKGDAGDNKYGSNSNQIIKDSELIKQSFE